MLRTATISLLLTTPLLSFAQLREITINNHSHTELYIHQGGYAPSQRLAAGHSTQLRYPFNVTPPNNQHAIKSSYLVITEGGRWLTTPNGFTFLHEPTLCTGKNYQGTSQANVTWNISDQSTSSADCMITGFRQLWWQPPQA